MESTGFWILAGGGIAAVLLGYMFSKRAGMVVFPWWQLILVIAVIIIASTYFATKD